MEPGPWGGLVVLDSWEEVAGRKGFEPLAIRLRAERST